MESNWTRSADNEDGDDDSNLPVMLRPSQLPMQMHSMA